MTNLSEEEKTFWKKVPLIDGILKKILRYNREKIHKIFVKQTNYNSNNSILDIGTTSSLDDNHNIILQKTKDNKNVFCLSDHDLFFLKKKYPHVKQFIKGDGKKINFEKDNFDIVFASATIEHVGSYNNQINFLRECLRVSKNYVFITTPNRYYPLDFHTKIPLIHWLPKKIHRKILKLLGLNFYSLEKNLNLLSKNDIQNILKILKIDNYKILKMNFLLLCSNLILIIKKNNIN